MGGQRPEKLVPRLCFPAPWDPHCWAQTPQNFVPCLQFLVSKEGL